MNINKSTGHDMIPPKLVRLGAQQLCTPITYLINKSIETSTFPESLKLGDITPVFKNDNMLIKKNYRPINILACLSKIFEGILVLQLNMYFDNVFSPYMSGFRKRHSCQNVLVKYVENCKNSLDKNKVYGTLLTDLSKAFDCLPPRLLITKLQAYGVSEASCMLIANYFKGRSQRVKIGNTKSEWLQINKGCPQGSRIGPLAYNIFSNDLLLLIQDHCDIYNYADDNSIGCSGESTEEVVQKLQMVASLMLNWFDSNYLQANRNKFQFIIHNNVPNNCSLSINNVTLKPMEEVKLLGVIIDRKLSFTNHINRLCTKAGQHNNAMARLSNVLNENAKNQLFQTFILSHFNFCPIICHYCSMSDLKKIERVQKRALRIIFNDYSRSTSYVELRSRANRPLLYVERLRNIVIEIFKIYKDLAPTYLRDVTIKSNSPYSIRNENNLLLPNFRYVKYGYNSFKFNGILLWNNLPNDIKRECNFKKLKSMISKWNGPQHLHDIKAISRIRRDTGEIALMS